MGICYLDYNATTPVADEVRKVFVESLNSEFANPSSPHSSGKRALALINRAREQVAELLKCNVREIFFTSGATESNNHAIRGALKLASGKKRIVTTAVEHSSVRSVLKYLQEREGFELTILPVDRNGALNLEQFRSAIAADVALVSVMWANNETGVIFPIDEIIKITKEKKVFIHVDAVQVAGKVDFNLAKSQIDFLSLSAHKFYGPKGTGILYVNQAIDLPPLIIGGSQERGKRGGTENLSGIVGMGKAAELIERNWQAHAKSVELLRNRLEIELTSRIPHSFVNGAKANRIFNTTNIALLGTTAEVLIPLLDEKGICVSSGAACLTGAIEPSHVLLAMGLSREQALASLRFSLGWPTTEQEINYAIDVIPDIVRKMRESECSIP